MFVCFEGLDGAGKSTQARMLLQRLKKEGVPAELVADPGTTKIGSAIRQILLQNDEPISAPAQMLLFSAARAELATYIRQQRSQGVTVLCDRWLLSTLVYQGELNNICPRLILDIFAATSNVYADICFLLDIEPDAARYRIGKPRDRYERRCVEDQNRMRTAYLTYSQEQIYTRRVYTIPADRPAEETHADIYSLFCSVRDETPVTAY